MSKYNIDQIMGFVLKEAENRETAAGMQGSWSDGGAEVLRLQVEYYKMGMAGKVPPSWEKLIPPPTPEEIRSEKHPLQFEYCECGCKSHSGSSKGIGYSIHNDLKSKLPFTVRRGHGWMGTQIGPKVATFGEAVRAAQADWDKIP